jgi:hypothetical protein
MRGTLRILSSTRPRNSARLASRTRRERRGSAGFGPPGRARGRRHACATAKSDRGPWVSQVCGCGEQPFAKSGGIRRSGLDNEDAGHGCRDYAHAGTAGGAWRTRGSSRSFRISRLKRASNARPGEGSSHPPRGSRPNGLSPPEMAIAEPPRVESERTDPRKANPKYSTIDQDRHRVPPSDCDHGICTPLSAAGALLGRAGRGSGSNERPHRAPARRGPGGGGSLPDGSLSYATRLAAPAGCTICICARTSRSFRRARASSWRILSRVTPRSLPVCSRE